MSAIAIGWDDWHRAVTQDLLRMVDAMDDAVPGTLSPAGHERIEVCLTEARHAAYRHDRDAMAQLFERVVATLVAEFRGTP